MLFVDSVFVNEDKEEHPLSKILKCPICGTPLQWVETLPKGLSNTTTMWKDHVP